MTKIYLKLDGDIIRDVITYPYEGYVEGQIDEFPVPAIHTGWYRWNGETYTLDKELFDEMQSNTSK